MTLLVPGQMGKRFVIITLWFWNRLFLDQFLQVLLIQPLRWDAVSSYSSGL